MFKTILKPFASLRLTVALLAMSMIVVFAGTWAQIDLGIWQVQRKYFHSFFCIIDFNIFLPRSAPDLSAYSRPVVAITEFFINVLSRIRLPMLGGYSLIVLLLVNLLAAHTVRFKLNARRIGDHPAARGAHSADLRRSHHEFIRGRKPDGDPGRRNR